MRKTPWYVTVEQSCQTLVTRERTSSASHVGYPLIQSSAQLEKKFHGLMWEKTHASTIAKLEHDLR